MYEYIKKKKVTNSISQLLYLLLLSKSPFTYCVYTPEVTVFTKNKSTLCTFIFIFKFIFIFIFIYFMYLKIYIYLLC
jgi:hypothetical protein